MRIRQSALLIVASALAGAAPAQAQHCYRPRPLPACKSFVITEYSVAAKIAGEPKGGDVYFSGELGFMSHLSERSAVGVSLQYYGLGGDGGFRYGVKPRYRRWLTDATSVDFAAGLLLGDHLRVPGFTGHAAVNLGVVGVGIQVDAFTGLDAQFARSGVDWYLMGRLGSKEGVAATLLTAVVLSFAFVMAGAGTS